MLRSLTYDDRFNRVLYVRFQFPHFSFLRFSAETSFKQELKQYEQETRMTPPWKNWQDIIRRDLKDVGLIWDKANKLAHFRSSSWRAPTRGPMCLRHGMNSTQTSTFLPARPYGRASISYDPVSVRVCLSVCHKSVFYRNGYTE